MSCLTYEQSVEIRQALANGSTQKELSERFGVRRSIISSIKLGQTYKRKRHRSPLERFEEKYVVTPDGHWRWLVRLCLGRGHFAWDGRNRSASSASWLLYRGEIPEGYYVLHKRTCPYRDCVNPDCLYLGTALENTADRIAVNAPHNYPCGEANCNAKLTGDAVREILTKSATGTTTTQLMKEYGMVRSTINNVLNRKTYKNVVYNGPVLPDSDERRRRDLSSPGEANGNSFLTEAIVRKIRADYTAGIRQCDLMRKYGLKRVHINNIVNRKSWKRVV